MSLRAVAVVASRPGGATAALAEAVLTGAAADGAATALFCLGHDATVEQVAESAAAADVVVLATPTYRATYAGLLKQFLDQLPRGGPGDGFESALRSKPVAVVATGASDHHFLGVDSLLSVLTRFFGAWVVPPAVYSGGELTAAVAEQARALGSSAAVLAGAALADARLRGVRPQI